MVERKGEYASFSRKWGAEIVDIIFASIAVSGRSRQTATERSGAGGGESGAGGVFAGMAAKHGEGE
jgi:hypothetical protein